jgi:hypothetical protein
MWGLGFSFVGANTKCCLETTLGSPHGTNQVCPQTNLACPKCQSWNTIAWFVRQTGENPNPPWLKLPMLPWWSWCESNLVWPENTRRGICHPLFHLPLHPQPNAENWVFQKQTFSPLPKTEVGYFRSNFFLPCPKLNLVISELNSLSLLPKNEILVFQNWNFFPPALKWNWVFSELPP